MANEAGMCVTVTRTLFVYKGGSEPGAIVELINYPRFPLGPTAIRRLALSLAKRLKSSLRQIRVSVVFPDETVMLGRAND
jgi:hypothetical protein